MFRIANFHLPRDRYAQYLYQRVSDMTNRSASILPFKKPIQRQTFETERFTIVSLSGNEAKNLVSVLLQDELLASRIDWMTEKSHDGAMQAAFGIELQCNAGQAMAWGIIERARRMQIGAVLAIYSFEGLDVEVLVASQFWDQHVSEEAAPPVLEWLQQNAEVNMTL
ncbi:hypothetical protein AB3X96_38695 [Paraburkholderia sp. BR13439]|uniref:hypothetical protein n=1 Tax=Paraburkholderia sp. BR13439 TaxID=3236996 RepID=UPI0034CD7947